MEPPSRFPLVSAFLKPQVKTESRQLNYTEPTNRHTILEWLTHKLLQLAVLLSTVAQGPQCGRGLSLWASPQVPTVHRHAVSGLRLTGDSKSAVYMNASEGGDLSGVRTPSLAQLGQTPSLLFWKQVDVKGSAAFWRFQTRTPRSSHRGCRSLKCSLVSAVL